MKEIELTKGMKTQVDDHNFDWLNQEGWFASKGGINKEGEELYYAARYEYIKVRGKTIQKKIYMHREIMKRVGKLRHHSHVVDHINGNGLYNLESNLRSVSKRANMNNGHENTKCKFPGVRKVKDGYAAYIAINGKQRTIKVCKTKIEAYQEYLKECRKLNIDIIIREDLLEGVRNGSETIKGV